VLDRPVDPGVQSEAEGSHRDPTMCNYRVATVFTLRRGAAAFYRQQRGAPPGGTDLHLDGASAFVEHHVFAAGDPRGDIDTVFLLRDGQYVNVLLTNAPAGAVEALARRLVAR
jgi:hypothetical protein